MAIFFKPGYFPILNSLVANAGTSISIKTNAYTFQDKNVLLPMLAQKNRDVLQGQNSSLALQNLTGPLQRAHTKNRFLFASLEDDDAVSSVNGNSNETWQNEILEIKAHINQLVGQDSFVQAEQYIKSRILADHGQSKIFSKKNALLFQLLSECFLMQGKHQKSLDALSASNIIIKKIFGEKSIHLMKNYFKMGFIAYGSFEYRKFSDGFYKKGLNLALLYNDSKIKKIAEAHLDHFIDLLVETEDKPRLKKWLERYMSFIDDTYDRLSMTAIENRFAVAEMLDLMEWSELSDAYNLDAILVIKDIATTDHKRALNLLDENAGQLYGKKKFYLASQAYQEAVTIIKTTASTPNETRFFIYEGLGATLIKIEPQKAVAPLLKAKQAVIEEWGPFDERVEHILKLIIIASKKAGNDSVLNDTSLELSVFEQRVAFLSWHNQSDGQNFDN